MEEINKELIFIKEQLELINKALVEMSIGNMEGIVESEENVSNRLTETIESLKAFVRGQLEIIINVINPQERLKAMATGIKKLGFN